LEMSNTATVWTHYQPTLVCTCRQAKEKQLRIWKGYQPTSSLATAVPIKSKNFTAKVVEIVNADALVVKTPEGSFQKIHFSSLRPPRYAYACRYRGYP